MSSNIGPASLRELRSLFESGTVAGMSDGQLLERFLVGRDEAGEIAFAALVARHGPMVLGVCRRALSDPEDAADAFQATFLILVKKARTVRVDDSLGRWLYGVSRKVAGRARVVAARRPKVEVGRLEWVEAPSPDPDRFEPLALLDEELGRLPEAFRSAIVLCDLGGMTHEEAARDLRCPVGTIKSRLARARKRLRERLEGRGLTPSAMALAPSVPAALVKVTARVSWLSATSGSSAAGMVPASSVILAQEVLKAMSGFPLKLAAAVLSIGIAVTGAGVLAGGQDEGKAKADPAATKVESSFVESLSRIQESRRLLIEVVGGDQAKLESKAMTLESLTNALKALNGANDPGSTKVHLRASSDQRYSDVVRVVYAIELAGIRDIRFDPAGSEVEAKLDKPVSLVVSEKPLSEVVNMLQSQTGLSIVLDNQSLQRKGLTGLASVTIATKDLALRKVLKYMLRPLDLTYQIEDNYLLITTTEGRSLESLQRDLDASRKKLDKARRIARDADDPAVVRAAREVAEIEAEIEKINKTQPDDPKSSPATSRAQRFSRPSRASRSPASAWSGPMARSPSDTMATSPCRV
jgi:RNA polymerase sigma factor (sigma-70 family)